MSHTNIRSINSTEINNTGPFRVGSRLTSGTAGQVLKSRGRDKSPEWDDDNDTTYQGSATIDIDTTTDPDTINCIKVPHALTFTGYDTGTFDGSSALSINLVNTEYTAGNGIQISGSNIIQTKTDNQTIRDSGGGSGNNLEVIKVPNTLTFTGYATGTFDGSSALSINLVDTDTTYQGGKNISINTATNPDTINLDDDLTGIDSITFTSTAGSTALTGNNYPSNPTPMTNFDLSSSTNVFPNFVGGSEILKSMSFIDNTSQNRIIIYNTSNKFIFDGSTHLNGSDQLEIDFTATSTTGYCEFGFYANSGTSGMIFYIGIAAATGGTSPFATTLTSSPVSIDAYKIGLLDGSTSYYSLRELLDFTGFENTYLTSKFYFNNLSVGTRYRMALYGRCYNSGNIYIHSGGRSTTGLATGGRVYFQPAFMKFYEYDSSIGGARTIGAGGGGDDY